VNGGILGFVERRLLYLLVYKAFRPVLIFTDVIQQISVPIRGFFENNSMKSSENFNANRSQLVEEEVCQISQSIVFSFMPSYGSNISYILEQYSVLLVQCSVPL
jgi:hypothetical protein